MKTVLDITIQITSDTTFDVEIHEPESGDFTRISCHDDGESIRAENDKIIGEIRDWVSILRNKENA